MMKHAMIVYSSRGGQTQKIVAHLRYELEKADYFVHSYNTAYGVPALDERVSLVICGSPVYAGRFVGSTTKWVRDNHAYLRNKTLGFFTVSLNRADQREIARQTDRELLNSFVHQTGRAPHYIAAFAGSLNYTRYSFLIRHILRRKAGASGGSVDISRDHEYTDWRDVSDFAETLRKENEFTRFSTGNVFENGLNYFIPEFEFSVRSQIDLAGFELDEVQKVAETLYEPRAGEVRLASRNPHEILYGRIGHITTRGFNPAKVADASDVIEAPISDRTREIVSIKIETVYGEDARVTVELRAHSLDAAARQKARLYYLAMGAILKIRGRSFLVALRRLGLVTLGAIRTRTSGIA